MNLEEYKPKDKVQVLINNPRNNNLNEWRDGVVIDIAWQHPMYGARFRPYAMVLVKYKRTYFTQKKGFYDKDNIEGFVYPTQIKLTT